MNYALQTLWHDRAHFWPGVFAISFSASLIALQSGLLLGIFSITSLPIDHTRADVWVGSPQVVSVDLGQAVPSHYISRVLQDRRVKDAEALYVSYADWTKSGGGSELCIIIGSNLDDGNLGTIDELTAEMRVLLTQPASVIIDASERRRLGVSQVGDKAEINGQTVQVVGMVEGIKSLTGPYVFCSRPTAARLMAGVLSPDEINFYLIKCFDAKDAGSVAADLAAEYPDDAMNPPETRGVENRGIRVLTSQAFSTRTRLQWLLKTKAGIALGFAALVGLLVGTVVTSQTLYAATMSSAREYAILRALGIPSWRIRLAVLMQSFWIGIFGINLAYPIIFGLKWLANELGGIVVLLPVELMAGSAGVTMAVALLAGTLALRSIQQIEPMSLLR